jgi:tripartite-type tricarboxylate transporter receptor subunit TctC
MLETLMRTSAATISVPLRGLIRILLGGAVVMATLAALPAQAAGTYPQKSVRVIVAGAPGSSPDVAARIIAKALSEQTQQPFVVEDRAGANGNLGGAFVAKATPDGYTLLYTPDSLIVINPNLYKKMTFDPLKELVPVASVVANQLVLTVNANIPVKTMQEFVAYAKRANPPLTYASPGNGSQHQIAMEILKAQAGIEMLHVPYKGGPPAAYATIASDTAAMFGGTSTAPLVTSGQLRALAVTGDKRSALFPGTPRVNEAYPSFDISPWGGMFAPAGTPPEVLQALQAQIAKALQSPEVIEQLNANGGMQPYPTSATEFASLIAKQHEKYRSTIKAMNIQVE